MKNPTINKIALIGVLCLIIAIVIQTELRYVRVAATNVHDFYIPSDELPVLRGLLSQFAATENFSLYEYGAKLSTQDGQRLFAISLNKKDSIIIDISNQRIHDIFTVSYFNLASDPDFDVTTSKLDKTLRSKWPNTVRHPNIN